MVSAKILQFLECHRSLITTSWVVRIWLLLEVYSGHTQDGGPCNNNWDHLNACTFNDHMSCHQLRKDKTTKYKKRKNEAEDQA